MTAFRFSARPNPPQALERAPREVFRRFFDLIERLERPAREPHPPAPEVKARISRLDEPARRQT